eukprot:m51a1_g8360 putative tyrosine (818) ;mRNA; f:87124-91411
MATPHALGWASTPATPPAGGYSESPSPRMLDADTWTPSASALEIAPPPTPPPAATPPSSPPQQAQAGAQAGAGPQAPQDAYTSLERLLRGMQGVPRETLAAAASRRCALVCEGPVLKMCRTLNKRRYIWLFQDCAVYAAAAPLGGKPSFRGVLTSPRAYALPGRTAGGYGFRLVSQEKSFAVIVQGSKERDDWLTAFKSTCLDEFQKERKATSCMACGQSFGLLRRRKHCTQCGRAMCSACCAWYAVIPDIDPVAQQRVCRSCFTQVAVSAASAEGAVSHDEEFSRTCKSTEPASIMHSNTCMTPQGTSRHAHSGRNATTPAVLSGQGVVFPPRPSRSPNRLSKSLSDDYLHRPASASRSSPAPPSSFRVSAVMAAESSGSSPDDTASSFASAGDAPGSGGGMLVWPQSLRFGLGSRQAPVGRRLEDSLTLANRTREKMYFQVLTPLADQVADRCRIEVEPSQGSLPAGRMRGVRVSLTVQCTTVLDVALTVVAWPASSASAGLAERIGSAIMISVESQLSTRLDASEISLKHPPIGEGSFGSVYRGKYRGLEVAVKVLKREACGSAAAAGAVASAGVRSQQEAAGWQTPHDFEAEVHYLSQVRHPCIVNFIGAAHTPKARYIVTEYCKYGNLTKAMHMYCFTDMLKIRCLLDCSSAMDFLHQSNILHRDLKPDNLLVVSLEAAAPVVCKVSDFGTMRDFDSSTPLRPRSGSNVVGSPLYMAPEIFLLAQFEKPCDVFSFAVVMYEIMTELKPDDDALCRQPWDYTRLLTEGWRPKMPENLNPAIRQLISDCWMMDPRSRPDFTEITKRLAAMCQLC